MRHFIRVFAFIFFLPACIPGQSINSGTITGTVTDPSGAAIPGAGVQAANAVTGISSR